MKNNQSNILLTGFRATGKSTVGRLLAQRLGLDYMDMDIELSKRLGGSVSEVVGAHGWAFFRKAEAHLLDELSHFKGYVIATGGGAIEHQEQWQRLRKNSYVFWLDADATIIDKRVQADPLSSEQRPCLSAGDGSSKESTRKILERRRPLYRLGADVRLDAGKNSPEQLTTLALAWLETREQEAQA
ncbi:shikimate kinase [Desulfobulbus rhabdoformis]|uniref:shikimate kinase n=1 Tax=Desulfobulbus rhabdoformis TaxID=34032 RepID=UPI001962D4AA|nr:shikimate kinase [Desulfobulbus rhabdoformis]MBM9614303.1 shikimate kinase [Desulfobulbus rhabdoformis]